MGAGSRFAARSVPMPPSTARHFAARNGSDRAREMGGARRGGVTAELPRAWLRVARRVRCFSLQCYPQRVQRRAGWRGRAWGMREAHRESLPGVTPLRNMPMIAGACALFYAVAKSHSRAHHDRTNRLLASWYALRVRGGPVVPRPVLAWRSGPGARAQSRGALGPRGDGPAGAGVARSAVQGAGWDRGDVRRLRSTPDRSRGPASRTGASGVG
jgi:hypothetical protein